MLAATAPRAVAAVRRAEGRQYPSSHPEITSRTAKTVVYAKRHLVTVAPFEQGLAVNDTEQL